MKLVYVAAAYRDDRGAYYIQRNIERARDFALWLWRHGYAVICPHMNTALLDGSCPDSVWLEGDIEMLKRCDMVFVLRQEAIDWNNIVGNLQVKKMSSGVLDELKVAKENKIPVSEYYLDDTLGFRHSPEDMEEIE